MYLYINFFSTLINVELFRQSKPHLLSQHISQHLSTKYIYIYILVLDLVGCINRFEKECDTFGIHHEINDV